MSKLSPQILVDVGLSHLPANLADCVLRAAYSVLETRVGFRLASGMTDEQLDEFEALFEAKDEAGASEWLEANLPDYRAVIEEEMRAMVVQLSRATSWIGVVARS